MVDQQARPERGLPAKAAPPGGAAMAKATEAVKVVVRCRPLNDQERRDGRKQIVDMDVRAGQVTLRNPKADPGEAPKAFTFDQVYDADVAQREIFDITARPIIDAVMDGYNGTIFAYGQTGTGKSFTMEGRDDPPELRGIIPAAFNYIFDTIAREGGAREFLVRATYLEIYNEDIRDLLSKQPDAKLELKESPDRGVYVRDLMQFVVKGVAEINSVLMVGKRNRSVGATMMNQDSSRSHSIFTITVETTERIAGPAVGADGAQPAPAAAAGDGHIRVGKLNLVDLAGSERQSKTGATGDRLKEGIKINLSLTALGNVISALVDAKSGHIPYRDSKLTRLLQDSLGGNTKTVMVANVGPADWNYDETLSTLRYANRAKNITNKPRINEDPKDAMLRQFQEEISRLKQQLAERQAASGGGAGPAAGRTARAGQPSSGAAASDGALMERLRADMAAEIEAKVRRELSAEAAAAVRAEAEANAAQQLEAAMADSGRTEEQRHALREALKRETAELAAVSRAAEAVRREEEELKERIKAMQSKVIHGDVNLLDVADKLKERSAVTKREMEVVKRQEEEQKRRLQQLELRKVDLSKAYSSLGEEVAARTQQLKALHADYRQKKGEVKDLRVQFQSEREALLEDYRDLRRQNRLKNLVIASFVPTEHQDIISEHMHWDSSDEAWYIDFEDRTGNAERARREQGLAQQGPSGGARPLDLHEIDCRRMEGLYRSYASLPAVEGGSGGAQGGSAAGRRPGSAGAGGTGRRPGSAGGGGGAGRRTGSAGSGRATGSLGAALAAAGAAMAAASAVDGPLGGRAGSPSGGTRPRSAARTRGGGGGGGGVLEVAATTDGQPYRGGGAPVFSSNSTRLLSAAAGFDGGQQQQQQQQMQQQEQEQQQQYPTASGLVKASVEGARRPASARPRRD